MEILNKMFTTKPDWSLMQHLSDESHNVSTLTDIIRVISSENSRDVRNGSNWQRCAVPFSQQANGLRDIKRIQR